MIITRILTEVEITKMIWLIDLVTIILHKNIKKFEIFQIYNIKKRIHYILKNKNLNFIKYIKFKYYFFKIIILKLLF